MGNCCDRLFFKHDIPKPKSSSPSTRVSSAIYEFNYNKI